MNKENFLKFYNSYKSEIIGALVGLIIGLSILFIGFFKFMLVVIFVLAGLYIGHKLSKNPDFLKNIWERLTNYFKHFNQY